MAIHSLKDVYREQLQDLYSACEQSLPVTQEMGRAAHDTKLKEALIDAEKGISRGMDEVASLCAEHDVDPKGEFCRGMQGLVQEARAHGLDEPYSDPASQDAMLISQYQRMCHYAIAGYGSVMAFANRLGYDGDAKVLLRCLDETREGDDRMTRIATEGGINREAAA